MEKKENKTWAIVGTVAAILLCGCPGLSMCIFGAVTAFGGMPDFISGYGNIPSWIGFVALCLSVVFVAIAVLVPVLTLRKKKEPKVEEVLPPSEPLPPAS
jgi:membrane protein implicated in regulation of membrane protease activity